MTDPQQAARAAITAVQVAVWTVAAIVLSPLVLLAVLVGWQSTFGRLVLLALAVAGTVIAWGVWVERRDRRARDQAHR